MEPKEFKKYKVKFMSVSFLRNNFRNINSVRFFPRENRNRYIVIPRHNNVTSVLCPPDEITCNHIAKRLNLDLQLSEDNSKYLGPIHLYKEKINDKLLNALNIPIISSTDAQNKLSYYLRIVENGSPDSPQSYIGVKKHKSLTGILVPPVVGLEIISRLED